MNIPFLISDILERIIPGSLFALFSFVFFGIDLEFLKSVDDVLLLGFVFVVSYSLGVVFNVISNRIPFLETRYFLPTDVEYLKVISPRFERTFEFAFNQEAWRYCYAVVQKESLTINTSFFAGMVVFCKSMFVCFVLIALLPVLIYFFPSISALTHNPSLLLLSLIVALGFAAVFCAGARAYGRSFTNSILDAFISWSHLPSSKP